MARAKAEEQVKANLIDEKKLVTIMKMFLGTKAADPDETKYFKVENGLNFMATTYGSAVQLLFKNKFEGSFNKGTGVTFFRKPLPKEQYEDVEFIPEMETETVGKKKVQKPTGRIHEFPDVAGFFNSVDLEKFYKLEIPTEDAIQFVAIHEAMEKAAKVGGQYNTAVLSVVNNVLKIKLHDSPLEFTWSYEVGNNDFFYMAEYHYDFALMTSIFKSLKDLKPDKIEIYMKDLREPILFIGNSSEYDYHFAIQRKLVR